MLVSDMEIATPAPAPSIKSPNYIKYDHITWYVGNAKQAASYFVTRMGFREIAYRGLETGSRLVVSHVVSNHHCTFVLTSPLQSPDTHEDVEASSDNWLLNDIHTHLSRHGDGVKDVAFEVDDARAMYDGAIAKGVSSVQPPRSVADGNGEVVNAIIQTCGDTTHTFIDRSKYRGAFLPGYRAVTREDPVSQLLPSISLDNIDHCVLNQDWGQLNSTCD